MSKTAVAFLLLSCASLFAQTGEITGRIIDPAGAVVPGVQVTITATPTGVRRLVNTNTEGYYSAPSLLPGPIRSTSNTPASGRSLVPNTTFASQTFGTVRSQADQPRVLQFAMKLVF